MASARGHYCFFCKISLKTVKGWLNHLLSPDHQAEARKDVDSWDFETAERVLVAFGKFSLATEAVLRSFGEQDGKSNLSEFVWNEKRPRVGLLVFETREKADAVLNGLSDGYQMKIGDYQLLQLRKAVGYFDLEWEELIAQHFRTEFKTEFKAEVKDEKLPTSKRARLEISSSDDSSSKSDDLDEVDKRTIKIEPLELAPSRLCSQFDIIRNHIEIEDAFYSQALVIMEKCQRVLNSRNPIGRLYMFRYWYLKLRVHGANELLFYVDVEGVLGGIRGGVVGKAVKRRGSFLASVFSSSGAQEIRTGIRRIDEHSWRSADLGFEKDRAIHFEDVATKVVFTLVTDSLFAVEAQTCRLFNYLLEFDPRARPFLTLIFYWARQNQVKTERSSRIKMLKHLSYAFAPEPAGLAWMVISFLCHKGILPTPREIVERQKSPIGSYLVGRLSINIGFRMDDQFPGVWRAAKMANCPKLGSDEFILHLVTLSKEFFEFYGQLRTTSQNWVLNTRDGELVRKEAILGSKEFKTRLTKKELVRLRNPNRNLSKKHVSLNGLAKGRFIILHPLIIEWTIPCDEDNFFGKISLEMLASANFIEIGLPTLDGSRGDADDDKKSLTTLQNLFRRVTLMDVRPFK